MTKLRCVVLNHNPLSVLNVTGVGLTVNGLTGKKLDCQTNHGYSFTTLSEMMQWINLSLSKSNGWHSKQ